MALFDAADEATFVSALAEEEEEVQAEILRRAPERLRRAAFTALSVGERARLLRSLVSTKACSDRRVIDAAERLRARLGAPGTSASRQVLGAAELLSETPAPERRRLLAVMQAGDERSYRKLLGALVTEETLPHLPSDVLAAALLRIEVGDAALALSCLAGPVRMRLLAGLPPAQAEALSEEAEVCSGDPGNRDIARRRLFAEIRRAASERSVDLAPINERSTGPIRFEEEATA
jgi:Mg/Co/Ni transporter MgtE